VADLPHDFRYEKRMTRFFGQWCHRWVVEGATMAMEFHARSYKAADDAIGWTAGVEMHSATPTGPGAPTNARCWALSERTCWHDGSSLMGEDWMRWWKATEATDEDVFRRLAGELTERCKEVARG
jgi:hypothetical protein